MRVLIVMDSFKGNISSLEASEAVARGVRHGCPWAEIRILPAADGGEGTVDAFVRTLHGRRISSAVRGPLGEPVAAEWGLMPDRSAVIELAAASGLPLVPRHQRDPSRTSTFGTGQQILAALDKGCRVIVVGLGGSATNDGGMGILSALGARFLDSAGRPLPPVGASLSRVERIDLSHLDPRLEKVRIVLACDVRNPLCGADGAAHVYGPQKGASPELIARLDEGLNHFAGVIRRTTGQDVLRMPGAGAAGGAAAGLAGLTGAELVSGIELLAGILRLDEEIPRADVIFTGEGRIDSQTSQGKLICGLAARARTAGVPIVALVGCIRGSVAPLMSMGLTAVFSTAPGPCTTAQSFQFSRDGLERTASQVIRIIRGTLRLQNRRSGRRRRSS
jgi:glycerate kinase